MSFSIKLMENLSPTNFVTKSVSDIATATGNLRNRSSVVDPIVEIESALTSDILSRVNYARIEEFGRYYYITDLYLDITGLWVFEMHVDVLMSFASQIRQQNAIVARQENKYNLYLDDGWFMAYQDPEIIIHKFSNPYPFEHAEYVLVVAGNNPGSNPNSSP